MKDINITLPLTDFVSSHLGPTKDGCFLWEERPISEQLGLIIFNLTKNQHTCYIQFPDEQPNKYGTYVLWSLNAWRSSNELYTKQRDRAERERIERFIFEANVKDVAKACMREFYLDEDRAIEMARTFVRKGNKGAFQLIGVEKLKQTKDEL